MRISKIIFLILLLLLISGLSAARFFLLEQIATYALQRAGAEKIDLHISAVGLHQAHIDYLTARFTPDDNMRLPVYLQDISLHYNLSRLLSTAQCDQIIIQTIKVTLDDTSTSRTTPRQLPENIRLLNDELRKLLPVAELRIQQLTLQGDLPGALINRPIQVNTDHKDNTISSTILLQINPETDIILDLQSSDSAHDTLHILGRRLDNTFLRADLSLSQPVHQDKTFTFNFEAPQLSIPDTDAQISALKVEAAGTIQDITTFHLAHDSRIRFSSLAGKKLTINGCTLDLAGKYDLTPDGLRCSLARENRLQIKKITTDELDISELILQARNTLTLIIQHNKWFIKGNMLDIAPLYIKEKTRSCKTGSLSCRIFTLNSNQAGIPRSSKIRTPFLVLRGTEPQFPLKQLDLTLHLENRQLNADMKFSPAEIPGRIRGNVSHDFATASGSLRLHTDTPLNLNQDGHKLSTLFTPWQYPVDLNKGILAITAKGKWSPRNKTELTASVTLQQGSGLYKHFLFNGLDLSQDLVILPRLHSKRSGSVSLAHLVAGLDFSNLSTKIALLPSEYGRLPKIYLTDFRSFLFDGSLSSPAIQYDLNKPDSDFIINIEKINLAPLIKLLQQNDLQVSGHLSGSIPIRIVNKNISVKNGQLFNEPPGGEIRYTPANIQQQGLTGYALKAVENFQYDSLQATADYAPSGQLDLDIHLQGISPLLDDHRPVHLNIHAEQNLPELLQSLLFSQGLIEQLDKQLQGRYK